MTQEQTIKQLRKTNELPPKGQVTPWSYAFSLSSGMGGIIPDLAELPVGWSQRKDLILRSTRRHSDAWFNATRIAKTKVTSHRFLIDSKFETRLALAQDLCTFSQIGEGWQTFLSRITYSYLLTGNGYFIRIVRATKSPASKIVGILALDPHLCYRIGNPEKPVIYFSPYDNQPRELAFHEILMGEDARGQSVADGIQWSDEICPAEGVFHTIMKDHILEKRIREIESGKGFRKIAFVSPLSDRKLLDATKDGQLQRQAEGSVYNLGTLIYPSFGDVPVNVAEVELLDRTPPTSLEQERLRVDLEFANAVGVDPAEINPELVGKAGLDSGKRAETQQQGSKARGIQELINRLENQFTHYIMPQATTFKMYAPNIADKLAEANLEKEEIGNARALVDGGFLTSEQGANRLSDRDTIAQEFVGTDETDGGQVTDMGKVEFKEAAIAKELDFFRLDDEEQELIAEYHTQIHEVAADALNDGATQEETEQGLIDLATTFLIAAFLLGSGVDDRDDLDEESEKILQDEINETEKSAKKFAKSLHDDEIVQSIVINADNTTTTQGAKTAIAAIVTSASKASSGLSSYTDGLAAVVSENTSNTIENTTRAILSRLELWKQKVAGIVEVAKTYDPTNPNLRWEIDPSKENCVTCLGQNGRTLTAAEWRETGIHPRNAPNHRLECGGWRCGCRRVRA